VADIIKKFPQVNEPWLSEGKGRMFSDDFVIERSDEAEIHHGKLIPFYEAEAMAGNGYVADMAPAHQVGLIEIGSELRDSQSAIRVYGNSMVPTYPAGCLIGLKLHTDSFIEPGRVYVVETRENRYLKRLFYSKDKSCYVCISDNQMKYEDGEMKGTPYYPGFDIPREEVIRLHRVVGMIKRNIL
jgi:phage repressor protein C with HTH and peptisase S24 domain